MADYLEREQAVALCHAFAQKRDEDSIKTKGVESLIHASGGTAARSIIEGLEKLKPADVRPVVLCRDCKHRDNVRNGACMARRPDWFCADGEKREVAP